MEKKNRYLLYSIFYASLLLVAIGIYTYGYNPPTCNPPGCNLPAPINAGPDSQTKAGNLTIQGNLTTGGFTMSAGAEANKVLTTNASGVASWQTPAGGSLWTKTGSNIYYNTGNVGIGTDNPGAAKLKIFGGILDMSFQKIANLAEPTENFDAVTKVYADTLGGTDPCEGRYLSIKFTTNAYQGNLGGLAGANAICHAEFPGYTFCNLTQMNNSNGCLPALDRTFQPYYLPWADVKSQNSATGVIQSCKGWTSASGAPDYGSYINSATAMRTWAGNYNVCSLWQHLACCDTF